MLTQEEIDRLALRVQDRAGLYTEQGVDPLKMESLLDEVHGALVEYAALRAMTAPPPARPRRQLVKKESGEVVIPPGASPNFACAELARLAPAWMLWNDTRIEAHLGETADQVHWRLSHKLLSEGAARGDSKSQELLDIMEGRSGRR
jgi:hypothetical protein